MEPDVIRMYSSSPPPMDDPLEDEEEDEFGDFGTFSSGGSGVGGVPNSVSFSEFETPTTFNQTQALNATSPPELTHGRGLICADAGAKANGHAGKAEKTMKDLSNAELQTETLTNGFQGSPSSQKSIPFSQDNKEDFADFAAFSDKANEDLKETLDDKKQSGEFGDFKERDAAQPETANSNRTETEFASFAAFSEVNSEGTLDDEQSNAVHSQRGVADLEEHVDPTLTENSIPNRTEPEFADFNAFSEDCTLENNFTGSETAAFVSKDEEFAGFAFFPEKDTKTQTNEDCSSLNGNAFDASGSVCSSDLASESDCGVENVESSKPVVAVVNGMSEKDKDGSSETETETSFGRPLSTEALEEFGDMSTTGSVPSPPLQEETATPTGDDDDEEFGDFGDCLSAPEFGNFEQNKPQNADGEPVGDEVEEDEDDFGDFNSPKFIKEERGEAEFPTSESFGNFSAAAAAEEEEGEAAEEEGGWSAFGNEEMREETEGESWAAFSSEEIKEEPSRMDKTTASLSDRLEKLFHSSFPQVDAPSINNEAPSLRLLLEPDTQQAEPHRSLCVWVWAHMQDIHEALGLRYQWGGSHCNKALLCCLGIDTRNILFTGQKKQPVIVPMYAAGLGMLEPVKPVSAAEMIASIGQNSPCSSESVQEALPPVQFDWSSSGLTNPLDASGGSSLLNLDFFGPVEDSESGAASIPGVDPELFELTTAKLDSSKVTDAFARLMSTVQSTSTSTRKPRREENLSEEALKVISMFPDLSFMTAKVLMFPTTLTPHGAQTAESSEPEPEPRLGPENGAD